MQVREKQNIIKTKVEIPSQENSNSPFRFLKNFNVNKSLSAWIKLAISLLICYLIFDKLLNKAELINTYQIVLNSFAEKSTWTLYILIFALLPINWGLEAKKWQLLALKIEPIKLSESYKAVLSGISFNILTPLGLGDAIGRTMFLKSNKRFEALGSIILNRLSQLLPTLIFGLFSIVFIIRNYDIDLAILPITAIGLFLGLIMFFVFKNKISTFIKNKIQSNLKFLTASFEYYSSKELLQINLLSILRYAVFTTQFLIAFYIFKIDLPEHILLVGISWIFLIKTIAPSLSIFTDLAIREASALFYFGIWNVSNAEVTAVTLLIWVVNIIIPAIIGVLFIPNLKFDSQEITNKSL